MLRPFALSLVPLALTAALIAGATARVGTRTRASSPASENLYRRAMSTALNSAQLKLEAGIDFFFDRSSWSSPWRVPTTHYVVQTVHSHRIASDVAQSLEHSIGAFADLLAVPAPAALLHVRIEQDRPAYMRFGEDNGAEHSTIFGCFYTEDPDNHPAVTYYHDEEIRVKWWATHAAFHQFLAKAAPNANLPTWMEEGLARHFELLLTPGHGEDKLAGMRLSGRALPPSQLLSVSFDSYEEPRHPTLAAMLIRYLMDHRPGTSGDGPDSFRSYLRMLVQGDRAYLRHPVHRLLSQGLPELDRDFLAFNFPAVVAGQ